jgi:predicted solute-binding protein
MLLKLGFSTCPNDTFIFDALVHHKIDTEGLQFDLVLADVEELNVLAQSGRLDVTKLSYHAYAYVFSQYQLLDSGSALGRSNGPLLVSKHPYTPEDICNLRIAIPGIRTTAHLLLKTAFPSITRVTPLAILAVSFLDIEDRFTSRANWMLCGFSTDFLGFCVCANVLVGWLIRRMDYLA